MSKLPFPKSLPDFQRLFPDAYLNEFTFRFNRRFWPFNAFRSLLGIAGDKTSRMGANRRSVHRTTGRVSPALESWGDACLLAIALRLAAARAEAAEWRAHLSEGRG